MGKEGLKISKKGWHYLWTAPFNCGFDIYYSIAMKLQVYNTTKIYLIMVWEFPNKTTTRHFSNKKKCVKSFDSTLDHVLCSIAPHSMICHFDGWKRDIQLS